MPYESNRREVLQSKLFVPSVRSEYVKRPETAKLLDESWNRKLTVLFAPAGYGKTSLVSEWLQHNSYAAAWLSLDAADNDPVRYWNHVIAALETVAPNHFYRSRSWMHPGGLEISEALTLLLINELGMLNNPVMLILDDFHMIKSEEIHRTMANMISCLPDNVHIVMLTRDVVPCPFEQLKMSRAYYVIGKEQLCFNQDEIRQLFSNMGAGALSEREIRELKRLSEGWAALLCVMALYSSMAAGFNLPVLRNQNQVEIYSYLNEELFMEIDSDLKSFMLRTSIVEVMCPELCIELTGRKDAQALLELLQRSNSTVTRIELSASWVKYHQLFRDFLQNELKKQAPQEIPVLHEKAAKWYASNEMIESAVEHSLACARWDLAIAWICEHAPALIRIKRTSTIEQWLKHIPEELFSIYPDLMIVRSWTYILSGKCELALPDVQALSLLLQDVSAGSPKQLQHFAVELYIIETHMATLMQDMEGAISGIKKIVPFMPIESGYYPDIMEYYGSELFISRGLLSYWGRVSKTLQVCALVRDIKVRNDRMKGASSAMLAEIAYERNSLAEALQYSDIGAKVGYDAKMSCIFIPSMLVRIRILKATGSPDEYSEAWRRLKEGMRHMEADAHWDALISAFQVRIAVKEGNGSIVTEWLQANRLTGRGDLSIAREYEYVTLIRVLIWQNKWTEAERLLTSIHALMEVKNRFVNIMELNLLQADLLCKKGDVHRALSVMDETVKMAATEGYVRFILDEGPDIVDLLFKLAKLPNANQSPYAAYLQNLLEAAQASPVYEKKKYNHTNVKLLEALTKREIDLLKCMSQGMTNCQIGKALHLSEGTVKSYNNHLFAKLGVRNRIQAIELAKDAGILE